MAFGFRIIPSTSTANTAALTGKVKGQTSVMFNPNAFTVSIAGTSLGQMKGKLDRFTSAVLLQGRVAGMMFAKESTTVVLAMRGKITHMMSGVFTITGTLTTLMGRSEARTQGRISNPQAAVFLFGRVTGMMFDKVAAPTMKVALFGRTMMMMSGIIGRQAVTLFGRSTMMMKMRVPPVVVQQIIPQFRNFTPGLIKLHQPVTLVRERVVNPTLTVIRKILPGLKD